MTPKKKQGKTKLEKSKSAEEENLNNKIFVIILGFIILGLALFGKIVNDNVINSYQRIKTNFSLSNDNLSYVYNTYAVTTVDGIVKVNHGLKTPEELVFELHEKSTISNEKIKEYFEKTDCHKQKTLDSLKENIEKSNIYWFELIEKFKNKENANKFCSETLKSGELYEITDPILKDLSVITNCHLERVGDQIMESRNLLENFKKVCITSCAIGLLLVSIVIYDFIKDEIQKRSLNSFGGKAVDKPKRIVRRKKSP
jgi:hypothetical protein